MVCWVILMQLHHAMLLNKSCEYAITKPSPVSEHDRKTEQHSNEISIITFTQTIHDPDTVMIVLRYARFTETAMLTPCGFEEVTSPARLTRLKEYTIVRILAHTGPVILGRNHGRSRVDTGTDRNIRNDAESYGQCTLKVVKVWKCCRKKQQLGHKDQNEEETLFSVR